MKQPTGEPKDATQVRIVRARPTGLMLSHLLLRK